MKNRILLSCLCIGLLTFYLACEKDDGVIKEQTSHDEAQLLPTVKSITLNEAGPIFDRLKSNYSIDKHMQMQYGTLGKSTLDTLGVTIYTDEIKEVTLGDYTSYTMLMKFPEQDSTKFYNITMEEKNGIDGMFVTKYTPTQQWLQDKSTAFEGNISTYRVNEDIEAIDQDSGGSGATNNADNNDYYSEPSQEYPADCDGIIITTYESQTFCICEDHTPLECNGCSLGWYVTQVPWYECIPDSGGFDETDYGQGGNQSSGSTNTSSSDDDEDTSYTGIVIEDECLIPPPASLDGDCIVDKYERLIDQLGIEDRDTRRFLMDNLEVSDSIIEFLEENNYSDTSKGFAEIAIEALDNDGIDDGEVDFDDNVILSEEFKNNQKLKCVYDKLAGDGSTLFNDTIGAFVGNRNVNLILEIGDCIYTNDACAQTEFVGETGIITIKIENINAHPIEIAQMILHEAIHAELAKYVLEHHDEVDTNDHPRLFELYQYYRAFDVPAHHLDHPYMALNYITPLASALQTYDDNSYPLDHYKGFAWEGLENWDVNNVLETPLINTFNNFKTIVIENSEICN